MMTIKSAFAHVALLIVGAYAITEISSQSSTSTYSLIGQVSLAPTSYTYAYTVTTPTTAWSSPAFPTASAPSHPACIDGMCPALDGKNCVDSDGVVYGVLCNTRATGRVITSSGKKEKFLMERGTRDEDVDDLEKRDFTGTFDGCVGFCDTFAVSECVGVSYQNGYCMALDNVAGTFPAPGEIAALRQ